MPSGNLHGDWASWFSDLDAMPNESSPQEKARRGRAFERLLKKMFDHAGLDARTGFRPAGEEIDGSFFHRGRVMLLEAKWTASRQPASSLYSFRGKIEGKLVGTIGLFISVSGFSPEAINALIAGKTLNLILMDGDDLRFLTQGGIDIRRALDYKLRAAAEEGTPLVPLSSLTVRYSRNEPPIVTPEASDEQSSDVSTIVVVEGAFDAVTVTELAAAYGASRKGISVLPAGGHANLPLVARLASARMLDGDRIVIVADGDGVAAKMRDELEKASAAIIDSGIDVDIVVLDPNMETVLGLTSSRTQRRPQHMGPEVNLLRERIRKINISDLAEKNPDVSLLLRALGIPTRQNPA